MRYSIGVEAETPSEKLLGAVLDKLVRDSETQDASTSSRIGYQACNRAAEASVEDVFLSGNQSLCPVCYLQDQVGVQGLGVTGIDH